MELFLNTYKNLNRENLHELGAIYTHDIHFIDPAHEIRGLDQLTSYFSVLYQNLSSIDFSFHHTLRDSDKGYLQWDMIFCHRHLGGNKPVTVTGTTFLRFAANGKVYHHHDYFDLGVMVYEQLPIFGRLVRFLKRRIGK